MRPSFIESITSLDGVVGGNVNNNNMKSCDQFNRPSIVADSKAYGFGTTQQSQRGSSSGGSMEEGEQQLQKQPGGSLPSRRSLRSLADQQQMEASHSMPHVLRFLRDGRGGRNKGEIANTHDQEIVLDLENTKLVKSADGCTTETAPEPQQRQHEEHNTFLKPTNRNVLRPSHVTHPMLQQQSDNGSTESENTWLDWQTNNSLCTNSMSRSPSSSFEGISEEPTGPNNAVAQQQGGNGGNKKSQYHKTKLCPWHRDGKCFMGSACNYGKLGYLLA